MTVATLSRQRSRNFCNTRPHAVGVESAGPSAAQPGCPGRGSRGCRSRAGVRRMRQRRNRAPQPEPRSHHDHGFDHGHDIDTVDRAGDGPSGDAGDAGGAASTASTAATGVFQLTSPAFTEGGTIPDEFTCVGDDVSPPLAWSGVPVGTVELALVVRDPDADGFVHWVVAGLPAATGGLAETAAAEAADRVETAPVLASAALSGTVAAP